MRARLTAAAKSDIAEAEWYDAQAPGLGAHFLDEFPALALRLAENPRQFPAVRESIRRAGFRHFPYGLFFRIQGNAVDVFACFHASRDPTGWHRRG
ncbi:type II toxin-antitoxin system RelE/ParE family toxin [Azospirillum sp. A39]|uniref:type II toxin-antitoxin system RelE/ParE family toxin n=1 Tax=Azospirillum sp. A39 TaxID=3462279 RepID=UPI0040459E5A